VVCRSSFGTVLVMAVGALSLLACGGEDPESAAPLDPTTPENAPDTSESDSADAREWSLDFVIDGRAEPMTARATLKVDEGEPDVHVEITGRTAATDVMIIDLSFQGLEAVLGEHLEQVGLPRESPHAANGSLDNIWYYSQSGEVEFSLSEEGAIEGRFDIALARGEEAPVGAPVVFQADEAPTPMVGSFSGAWVLSCHSRLVGHGALVPDGNFCVNLSKDLGIEQ
jgi:hypothetical protein